MLMFILTISCLTVSNFPWFTDLAFQVPIQCCSLQHQILLSSPNTPTTERPIHFGPAASSTLGLLVILLRSSPVAHWAPSDLGTHLLVSYLSSLLYGLWGSHSKYTGVVCHSPLQWITLCQNSLLWTIRSGWPCTAWLTASLSYASPFVVTRQWSTKVLFVWSEALFVCFIDI